jgi:Family of unknown function (DUF6221)
MTIVEFLLARIGEEEAVARDAQDAASVYGPDFEITYDWARYTRHKTSGGSGTGFYPGAPSPARVLAECEAKRRIVADRVRSDRNTNDDEWQMGYSDANCSAVFALAAIDADHPDYDTRWRVGA